MCQNVIRYYKQEGMEFEYEDAAKIFYDEYARRVGFAVVLKEMEEFLLVDLAVIRRVIVLAFGGNLGMLESHVLVQEKAVKQ